VKEVNLKVSANRLRWPDQRVCPLGISLDSTRQYVWANLRTFPVGMLSLGGGRPDPLPLDPVFVGRGRAPPGRLGGVGADMTSMSRVYAV